MLKKLLFRLAQHYRHSTASRWAIFFLDCMMLLAAFVAAELFFWQENGGLNWPSPTGKLLLMGVISVVFFVGVGTYRGIIRHSGINDIFKIMIANIVPALLLIVFSWFNNYYGILNPRFQRFAPSYTEIVLTYSLLCCFMIISRLAIQRFYNDYIRRRRPEHNVIIYGAGAAGIIALNALSQSQQFEYKVVAFVDDDPKKVDQQLNGIPVMRARQALTPKFVGQKKVKTLLIAIPNVRLIHKQAISNRGLELGLTVKAVPHIKHWINGSFGMSQIQDIRIEDLLERESIKLDNVNVIREVVDKVVMVTGAAGSIGSEICRQLIQYKPSKIIMLDQAESPMYDLQFELRNNEPYKQLVDRMVFVIANVKDRQRMEEVFQMHRPQIVYHAAAYKHVPFMEENPYEALYVNVFGTKNLADLAIEYGAQKFVMISTDKAVNPTNVMGATKRMAEIYIQSRSTDKTHFVTTRFGNVLGSNGSVIPLFKKQLAAGGPLTVTHRDIIRYFMTIPEACNLVLEAGAMGKGGDIFVFDMGKPVKIYDMARKMIQLSGLKNIEIKEIGLRPGEKLYEELLATKENTIPTYHPKIMHAQVRTYALEDIDREYSELWSLMPTLDDMKLVAKMKSIVPEFVSNNSVYCQLDKQ